jgi:uncharacterized protein YggE
MHSQTQRILTATVGVGLLAAALWAGAAGFFAVPAAQAQTPVPTEEPQTPNMPAPGTITVIGEGKVSVEPDIARVTIGVETVKESVQEASAENKVTVEAVLDALRAQGIAEEDIQTTGFNIFAERYGPEGPLADSDVRYRVSNNVTVVIRDLDTVGEVLDAAVEAGANNIYGIEFALDDPSQPEPDAREMAVADAESKADELAGLMGLTKGRVVSISEVIGMGGGYYSNNFAQQARGMGGGGGAPIAPGQIDLIMQLQIVYAIE